MENKQLKEQNVNDSSIWRDKRNQYFAIIVMLLISLFLIIFIRPPSSTEVTESEFIAPQSSDDTTALMLESGGYSYAYGTASNDDGNTLENFVPASEQDTEALKSKLKQVTETSEDVEEQLIEYIEYDEWNNDQAVRNDVAKQLLALPEESLND